MDGGMDAVIRKDRGGGEEGRWLGGCCWGSYSLEEVRYWSWIELDRGSSGWWMGTEVGDGILDGGCGRG